MILTKSEDMKFKITLYLLMSCVFLLENTFAQNPSDSLEISGIEETERVHVIETSPLGLAFGTNIIGYSFIYNKNIMGAFGGPIVSYSSAADLSGYLAGVYYAKSLDLFKNDPGFFGAAVSYSESSGSIEVGGKNRYQAGLETKVASVSLFYGHAYKWKNGFMMNWRLGAAIPFIWEYDWENTSGASAEDFKDDTDLFEVISKIAGTLLGGSGWNIGWSF